jgi:signal transduction histidine kinase
MDVEERERPVDEVEALRRENAMLRATLDAIDGTVVVYGPNLEYCFGNRPYHEFFPYLPPEPELVGRSFGEVLALSIAAGAVPDADAYTDPQAFIARREAEMRDRDASTRDVHLPAQGTWSQIRVKWTPSGHRVALRIDITEQKRLQRERTQAQRMETIGRISGGIAHDFNNLLTVIISNFEMIRLRPSDPDRVSTLAANGLAAADAGAALIRQLLTFAQRDLARLRKLSPDLLLSEMAELLVRTVGAGIGFEVTLAAQTGLVTMDASQFESAVLNLVLNAREAIAAAGGAGQITLTTRQTEAPDGTAVSVYDTGTGMTEEVAAHAFEPFFTTKKIGDGPGLGLSQVYGFVNGIKGKVRIDSTPGRGTSVTMWLPAAA